MFKIKNTIKITSAALLMASSFFTSATVVEMQTSLGPIQINLFDETTPKTVENFLSYVNSGAYANNVVHRSVPGFVIQGGGFTYTGPIEFEDGFTLDVIPTGANVENEPLLSNVRGTIAMAKGSDPDSAGSQWFINLVNSENSLDIAANSGGFTVFGQVIGDGMQVVDSIADLAIIQYASPFGEVPIRNYTQEDVDNQVPVTDEQLVVISDIIVTDATVITNPDLNPPANTLVNTSVTPPPATGGDTDSGGGGSFGWLTLFAALGFSRHLKRTK